MRIQNLCKDDGMKESIEPIINGSILVFKAHINKAVQFSLCSSNSHVNIMIQTVEAAGGTDNSTSELGNGELQLWLCVDEFDQVRVITQWQPYGCHCTG
jgi:hypothetical protein